MYVIIYIQNMYINSQTHTRFMGNFHRHNDFFFFLLYKLYIQSPNPKTYPSQKAFCIFTFSKNITYMIYKLFSSWGQKMSPQCREYLNYTHAHTLIRTQTLFVMFINLRFYHPFICPSQCKLNLYTHKMSSFQTADELIKTNF